MHAINAGEDVIQIKTMKSESGTAENSSAENCRKQKTATAY